MENLDINDAFRLNLRYILKLKHGSNKLLCAETGLSLTFLSMLISNNESNRRGASLESATRICRHLHIPLDVMISRPDLFPSRYADLNEGITLDVLD